MAHLEDVGCPLGTIDDHAGVSGPSNRSKRRATRACDRCKYKKMRCTGKLPCQHCINAEVHLECAFTAKYTRGKAPPIQVVTANKDNLAGLPANVPSHDVRRQSTAYASASSSSESEHFDWQNRERKRKQSQEYPGLASISQRAHPRPSFSGSLNHQNPLAAFGDPPLPEPDCSFLVLPNLEEGQGQVTVFFETALTESSFLHRPTVDQWLFDFYKTFPYGNVVDKARSAIMLTMLAFSSIRNDFEQDRIDRSFRYFQAAEELLVQEKGEIRLESIVARLLQCFYLLERSRMNQAWNVFGTVVSYIYAFGLHRSLDSNSLPDLIQRECCRRSFWVAYNLDKHLALCLGRPQYFYDETVDQELPLLVNDKDLSSTSCLVNNNGFECTIRFMIYQKEQATILGGVLRDLYGIQLQSLEDRLALSCKHHNVITHLIHQNQAFLQQDASNLSDAFRQQLIAANLQNSLLIVVLLRAFILDEDDEDEEDSEMEPQVGIGGNDQVLRCLNAAMDIAHIIESLHHAGKLSSTSWLIYYCGYTAVVALYVFVIKHQDEPEEEWSSYFQAANKCRSRIRFQSDEKSFFQRCTQVMGDLHAEVLSPALDKLVHSQSRHSLQKPHHSVDFASSTSQPKRQHLPEVVYGDKWQNISFDQNAPGGGILGSMDWIKSQKQTSLLDQIEKKGFASLTGF